MPEQKQHQKNIFSLARLKFRELWEDASNAVREQYRVRGQAYSEASPFFQLLRVILHLGRMIFYYIEDSIMELNILTANRPTSIHGLSTLTGHDPFRGSCAKGIIKISFNPERPLTDTDYDSVSILNYTRLNSSITGLPYLIVLPTEAARLNLDTSAYIEVPIYQGDIQVQTVTGKGRSLQSFNIPLDNAEFTDHFAFNLYVNGVLWRKADSFYDMGPNENAYMMRAGIDGGLDLFFGDGNNGAIPELGSIITVQYVVHFGSGGNIFMNDANSKDSWHFMSSGTTNTGESINLDDILKVELVSDITLGANPESTVLTRLAAPHSSRSFVLANTVNYEQFLRRLNMFSIIDVIKGNNTYEDMQNRQRYDSARQYYYLTKQDYISVVNEYGKDSDVAKEIYADLSTLMDQMKAAEQQLLNSTMDDNVIYLFLVPDITKRINSSDNYFTCPETAFYLSKSEQQTIIDLIESSGQKVLTVENRILKPLIPRFAINIDIHKWSNVSEDDIYSKIISQLSKYFIENTRRDRIPRSDLIRIIDGIEGVDSVNVTFDADKNNINIFKSHYGIDDQTGDVILHRFVSDNTGDTLLVRDAYPLFRGGFESINNVRYSDIQNQNGLSAVNVNFIGRSFKNGTNYYSDSSISGRI